MEVSPVSVAEISMKVESIQPPVEEIPVQISSISKDLPAVE